MKKIFFSSFLLFVVFIHATSQPLIIKGRVKCMVKAPSSSKGAENVVIIPAFKPSLSTQTVSKPSGYFEFNTGMPISTLQDKTVKIYVVSRCKQCKEVAKNVFISVDQDRPNSQDKKQYVTIKEWMLDANCQQAELSSFSADSVLRAAVKQPAQDLDKVSQLSTLTGAPAFLNFITTVGNVVGTGGFPIAVFDVDFFNPGKIKYGNLFFASPLFHSGNTGFNFSPSRDMSEAVFWNPSAMAFARKPVNISLLTNLKNNAKLSAFYQVNEKVSVGAGGIYTKQDEFRVVGIKGRNEDEEPTDTAIMKLKEYAIFVSGSYRINSRFSVGAAVKSAWQDFNLPVQYDNRDGDPTTGIGKFIYNSIKKQVFDADISATYKINNSLQGGINIMNIAGSELHSDVYTPEQPAPHIRQRSYGFGLTYKNMRFNAGADALFTEKGFFDAAIGVNYVPFNNALISAGFTVKQLSYSASFRLKHFRLAYINDNNWMANDKRKGKSGILNGRLYGGFIFDLSR